MQQVSHKVCISARGGTQAGHHACMQFLCREAHNSLALHQTQKTPSINTVTVA